MTRPNELSRLKRMLSAIHTLEANRAYRFSELGELFGCSQAETKRLLADLAECCIDGRYLDFFYLSPDELEPDGGILTTGDFDELSAPKRLSPNESLALVCALDYLNMTEASDLRKELAENCLSKANDPNSIKLFICSTSTMRIVGQLSLLCEQQRYCTIEYAKPGSEPELRTLCPLELPISDSGVQYLYAYEEASEAFKLFRIDRMLNVEPSAKHFRISDYPAPEIRNLDTDESIVIQVKPSAAFDIREWSDAKELSPIGSIKRFEIPISDTPMWVARKIIASLGAITIECKFPESLARCIADLSSNSLEDIEKLKNELDQHFTFERLPS